MRKMTKSLLVVFAGITTLFTTTAFILSDSQADHTQKDIDLNSNISLANITTKNTELGSFKSTVNFKQKKHENLVKEFYGQEITIKDNPQVDRILIGVTNNLISRIEIWNKDNLIETEELGFMDKMTWGETKTISIDYYDQTNAKHKGKSRISLRFYDGTGFFGDIGTLNFDLTEYGDLSGEKSIGVFAKSIDSEGVNEPDFSDLQIWKNYKSFD